MNNSILFIDTLDRPALWMARHLVVAISNHRILVAGPPILPSVAEPAITAASLAEMINVVENAERISFEALKVPSRSLPSSRETNYFESNDLPPRPKSIRPKGRYGRP